MNPAFGLGELNKDQLGANGTYSMLGLTFRIRSIAVLVSTFWEYMTYAAATVALRPAQHNKLQPRIVTYTYMRGHALVPAWQWTRMPLPLSSSASMNVIEGIRCWSTSASSTSSRGIWCRMKVYGRHNSIEVEIGMRKRTWNTSGMESLPLITDRIL